MSDKRKVDREHHDIIVRMHHDQIVGMQAAWIEWRRGKGAEAAMQWIENYLSGPGLIPKEDEPWANDPQAYYDANKHDPWPTCPCGRPSNVLSRGKGYCSWKHCKQYEAN